jgi:hypothetical protein
MLWMLALIGCAELLPLTRRTFGFGFCLLLAGVFIVKHQLLVYVPVSELYQALNQYAAFALAVHLLGRFISPRMVMRHAGVPDGYPGMPWLRLFGLSDQAARLYGEPVLALVFALVAAQTVVLWRFRPLFFLRDVLPAPYGVTAPFPLWYRQYGVMIAHALPALAAMSLAAFNYLQLAPTEHAPLTLDTPLTFSEVQQPPAPKLPSPSVAAMARQLPQRGKRP